MYSRQRLYLIGFMGSGKSYLAQQLSGRLGWQCHDLDQKIIAHTSLSLPELFAERGVDFFRQVEQQLLYETARLDQVVIACGGGTPCYQDNMVWIKRHGISLWLDTALPVLLHRLTPEVESRPLLQGLSGVALEARIRQLIDQRHDCYQQADLIFRQEVTQSDPTSALLDALKAAFGH